MPKLMGETCLLSAPLFVAPHRRASIISHLGVEVSSSNGTSDDIGLTPRNSLPDENIAAAVAADRTPPLEGKVPPFLNHLRNSYNTSGRPTSSSWAEDIHPAVARVGVLMRHRKISGGNSRAVAMLNAFMRFLEDYTPVAFNPIDNHIAVELQRQYDFLVQCRPDNIAMGNAFAVLKSKIYSSKDLGSDELIQSLILVAAHFIQERIICATWRIAVFTAENYIFSGDHIVVFGGSTAVSLALLSACKLMRKEFRVTVVNTRSFLDAKGMTVELEKSGIEVAYTLLHSLAAFIPDCDKVFLGATAVMGSGSVMNRAGSASVAALAHSHGKPVYVLAETYKLNERGVSSPFAANILDDPRCILTMENSLEMSNKINPINLSYDIVDQSCLEGVISEEGFVPSPAIPKAVLGMNLV